MKIEDLTISDIFQIASLHQQNLESPGSAIGPAYLNNFYRLLILDPGLHINLKVCDKDKLIAVLTCTKDLKRTNMIFKKLLTIPVLVATIKAIISGKIKLTDLLNRFIFEQKVIRKYPLPYATILTLFVKRNYQRQGIGKKLIKELIERLKQDRVKTIHVDTYLKNKQALAFYQSLGFQIVEQITDSVILEHR